MTLYITEMQRWGDTETHHYIVGVFSTKEKADLAGNIEKSWRGNKYEPNIIEVEIDPTIDQEKLQNHIECTK